MHARTSGALHFPHRNSCHPVLAACSEIQEVAHSLGKSHHPLPHCCTAGNTCSTMCAGSPPFTVCCSSHTLRAPCTNTLPRSPDRTPHSAPSQTRARDQRAARDRKGDREVTRRDERPHPVSRTRKPRCRGAHRRQCRPAARPWRRWPG